MSGRLVCARRGRYDVSYLAALYIYHGLKWLVIVVVTYIGSRYHAQVLILSCALSGAALQTSALAQLMLTFLRWWDAYWKAQVRL